MNGGYFMIDASGVDLTTMKETSAKVAGFRAKAEEALSSGKPMVAYNLTDNLKPLTPIPAYATITSVYVALKVAHWVISVLADDIIEIPDKIPAVLKLL